MRKARRNDDSIPVVILNRLASRGSAYGSARSLLCAQRVVESSVGLKEIHAMSRCSSELRLFWLSLIVVTFVAGCVDGDAHPLMDASTPSGSGGSAAGSGGMPATNDGSGGAALGDKDAGLVGPSWSADVYPLLVAGCGGCHGEPSDEDAGIVVGRPGGPVESTGDAPGKFAVADSHLAYEAARPFSNPGDAKHSNLYIKISEDSPSTGGTRMPPALRQWDQASIDLVAAWIDAGAVED